MAAQKRPVRIFLAEDHDPDVVLIREALDAAGFDTDLERFADGESALERLSQYTESDRPDVIILDLNLPRITGLVVLSKLRANAALADVPVAILTSSKESADRNEALRQGAAVFISKPPDLDEFLKSVTAAIRNLLGLKGTETRGCDHRRLRRRPVRSAGRASAYREVITRMGARCSVGMVK